MQEHRDKPVLLGFWNISLQEFSCIFGVCVLAYTVGVLYISQVIKGEM